MREDMPVLEVRVATVEPEDARRRMSEKALFNPSSILVGSEAKK
jgi:hypothetical protein